MAKKIRPAAVSLGVGTMVVLLAAAADARTLQVPREHPTIQSAIDAAAAGDNIRVAAGRHCGAVVTKPLRIEGQNGAVIAGCASGPALFGLLRIGFLLGGAGGTSPASGTEISGFTFDGAGISDVQLAPLAFGIMARFAHDVAVHHNTFVGTVQAVTNTAGDRWTIRQNAIEGLTLFPCPGFCGGGDGIVVQLARAGVEVPGGAALAVNRPEDNVVFQNEVSGVIPDEHDEFSMVGILVLAADRTDVRLNELAIPANPTGAAEGQGITVSNVCCGGDVDFVPGARDTRVALNDGTASQKAVVIEGAGGANTQGLVLFNNRGVVEVEGEEVIARRSAGQRAARAGAAAARMIAPALPVAGRAIYQ